MTKVRILFSASQVSTLFTFTRIRVYSTLTRFITGVTSRFTVASPRVVSCVFIAMRARSSPPRRRLASSLFFRHAVQQTLSMCEENDLGPTRPLAGPRRSPDRRLAHRLFVRTSEPSGIELVRDGTGAHSPARTLRSLAHSASSTLTGH